MVNYLLFVLFFVISFLVVEQISVKLQVKKFQKRNNINFYSKDNFFKKHISKINLIKTKENFLQSQGYPLKLNGFSYYIIKIALTMLLFIAGLKNYNSFFAAIILGSVGFCFLDTYIMVYSKNRNNEICNDLLKIVNSLTLQLSSFVPLENALKNQYENCGNKDFRKAIMNFSAGYELTELNINNEINKLKSNFNILEVDMFCNALSQYNKLGNITELLDNLATTLKTKYVDKLKETTRNKVLYITFGVILALGNIILITFYPLFISVGNNFNQIFK